MKIKNSSKAIILQMNMFKIVFQFKKRLLHLSIKKSQNKFNLTQNNMKRLNKLQCLSHQEKLFHNNSCNSKFQAQRRASLMKQECKINKDYLQTHSPSVSAKSLNNPPSLRKKEKEDLLQKSLEAKLVKT
tara:strand:+ start:227 stop:616 length:390 start_codon:yes stop_codon:yes gene_type:complete